MVVAVVSEPAKLHTSVAFDNIVQLTVLDQEQFKAKNTSYFTLYDY